MEALPGRETAAHLTDEPQLSSQRTPVSSSPVPPPQSSSPVPPPRVGDPVLSVPAVRPVAGQPPHRSALVGKHVLVSPVPTAPRSEPPTQRIVKLGGMSAVALSLQRGAARPLLLEAGSPECGHRAAFGSPSFRIQIATDGRDLGPPRRTSSSEQTPLSQTREDTSLPSLHTPRTDTGVSGPPSPAASSQSMATFPPRADAASLPPSQPTPSTGASPAMPLSQPTPTTGPSPAMPPSQSTPRTGHRMRSHSKTQKGEGKLVKLLARPAPSPCQALSQSGSSTTSGPCRAPGRFGSSTGPCRAPSESGSSTDPCRAPSQSSSCISPCRAPSQSVSSTGPCQALSQSGPSTTPGPCRAPSQSGTSIADSGNIGDLGTSGKSGDGASPAQSRVIQTDLEPPAGSNCERGDRQPTRTSPCEDLLEDDSRLYIPLDELQSDDRKRRRLPAKRRKEIQPEKEEAAAVSCELDQDLDRALEDGAKQHNLTAVNVRNILHEVITNEHVVAMMKAAITETEGLPPFEPKMTRSKLKEVVEKGVVIPTWNLSPIKKASKVQVPQFVDIHLEEEDSSDEEYRPEEEEEDETAEESLLESDVESTASSPRGQKRPRVQHLSESQDEEASQNASLSAMESIPMGPPPPPPKAKQAGDFTFIEKLISVDEELDRSSASMDSFQSLDESLIAFRTRSKRPLKNVPIGRLEAELKAPDFTPDMYDHNTADDEHWKMWLRSLMQYDVGNEDEGDEDDDDDPEYNFLEDWDEPDTEDLRNDRAVRITKKEVNELMEELFETFQDEMGLYHLEDEGPDEDDSNPALDFNTPQAIRFEEPLANLLTEQHRTVKAQLEYLRMRKSMMKSDGDKSPPREPETPRLVVAPKLPPVLSLDVAQRKRLQQQMQQHVQLLTQLHLLTFRNPRLSMEAETAQMYLVELSSFAETSSLSHSQCPAFHSAFQPCNLKEALQLIPMVHSQVPEDPEPLKPPRKNDNEVSDLPKHMAWIMATRPLFIYPELLPVCAMRAPGPRDRVFFTKAEDNLLALGLKHMEGLEYSKQLISKYLLTAKTAQQLTVRMKNLTMKKSPDNIIKYYKKTKMLPPLSRCCDDVPPQDVRPPVDREKHRLPFWIKASLCSIEAQVERNSRPPDSAYPLILPPTVTLTLKPLPRRFYRRSWRQRRPSALKPLLIRPSPICAPKPPAKLPAPQTLPFRIIGQVPPVIQPTMPVQGIVRLQPVGVPVVRKAPDLCIPAPSNKRLGPMSAGPTAATVAHIPVTQARVLIPALSNPRVRRPLLGGFPKRRAAPRATAKAAPLVHSAPLLFAVPNGALKLVSLGAPCSILQPLSTAAGLPVATVLLNSTHLPLSQTLIPPPVKHTLLPVPPNVTQPSAMAEVGTAVSEEDAVAEEDVAVVKEEDYIIVQVKEEQSPHCPAEGGPDVPMKQEDAGEQSPPEEKPAPSTGRSVDVTGGSADVKGHVGTEEKVATEAESDNVAGRCLHRSAPGGPPEGGSGHSQPSHAADPEQTDMEDLEQTNVEDPEWTDMEDPKEIPENRNQESTVVVNSSTDGDRSSPAVAPPGSASPPASPPGPGSPHVAPPALASPPAAPPGSASPPAASLGSASPPVVPPGSASPDGQEAATEKDGPEEEEEEEDFDDLTQDEDEMSSASEESVLSIPELQETMEKLTWLASERRLSQEGDSEENSPEENTEEEEEEDAADGVLHKPEEMTDEISEESEKLPTPHHYRAPSPAPVETSAAPAGERRRPGARSQGAHRVRSRRGRARTSKDASKLLLLYDEKILLKDPLREQKDMAYAQSYLTRVREALQGVPGTYEQFLNIIYEFESSRDKKSAVDLYERLRHLLLDWPQLLRDFAAFLLPEQALECGLFEEQQAFDKSRRFLRQLEICFLENPAHHQKIIRLLQSCADCPLQEIGKLKAQMWQLLRGHHHLQEEFSLFFDQLRPPASRMEDFEVMTWTEDKGYKYDGFEEVTLPEVEEEEEPSKVPPSQRSKRRKEAGGGQEKEVDWLDGGKDCPCSCHDGGAEQRLKRCKRRLCAHCSSKSCESRAQRTAETAGSSGDGRFPPSRSSMEERTSTGAAHRSRTALHTRGLGGAEGVVNAKQRAQSRSALRGARRAHVAKDSSPPPVLLKDSHHLPPFHSGTVAENPGPPAEDAIPGRASPVPHQESSALQAGEREEQPLCAKNIKLSSSGEKVIVWTREADRVILTMCQERGAHDQTYAAISAQLGDKSPSKVAQRFRELVTLFQTGCVTSSEEEEEEEGVAMTEAMSDGEG